MKRKGFFSLIALEVCPTALGPITGQCMVVGALGGGGLLHVWSDANERQEEESARIPKPPLRT